MRTLRKPSAETIREFLHGQGQFGFTYPAVGATAGQAPEGYTLDHTRIKLGEGASTFHLAADALRRWDQFHLGWVGILPAGAPIEPDTLVAVVAHKLGLWWLNACRIIYVVDDPGPLHRFGFAYGTLPDHAGTGEERFLVEWDEETGDVHYDIVAFSQPHQFLMRVGYPYLRHSQKRFGRESAAAMIRAVTGQPPVPLSSTAG